jgi:hypothetical protein
MNSGDRPKKVEAKKMCREGRDICRHIDTVFKYCWTKKGKYSQLLVYINSLEQI